MSELLVNATSQPVEVHLADNVVVVLGPCARVQMDLGAGPHPMLDELVRRLVVSVVARPPEPDDPGEPDGRSEPDHDREPVEAHAPGDLNEDIEGA